MNFTQQYGINRQRCQQNTFYSRVDAVHLHYYAAYILLCCIVIIAIFLERISLKNYLLVHSKKYMLRITILYFPEETSIFMVESKIEYTIHKIFLESYKL